MSGGPPHTLFDRALIRRRRNRIAGGNHRHDFIFELVRSDFIERLSAINRDFRSILDLGSRTGTLARHLNTRAKGAFTVAGDLSERLVGGFDGPALVMDEERLPFSPGSFDLVVSALSLHWVNDLPGSLIQINRILRPDGLFLGALFAGETLRELRHAIALAETEIEGGMSPRIAPFADIRDLGGLLQRAGFALPVADTDKLTVRYKSPLDLMRDLRGMGETNPMLERRRTPLRRQTLQRTVEIYEDTFGLDDRRIPATFEIAYLTGWAPHEAQQKPLRPGTAQVSLAQVIGRAPSHGDD